jgi:hypothetical protein
MAMQAKDTDDFSKHRVGDILVCKAMAGRGLDEARIKVGCELSATRKPRAFVQRTNRSTRPYRGMLTADFITLADAYSVGFIKDLITNKGGHVAIDDLTLQRQWEQEKDTSEEATHVSVHDTTRAQRMTRWDILSPLMTTVRLTVSLRRCRIYATHSRMAPPWKC